MVVQSETRTQAHQGCGAQRTSISRWPIGELQAALTNCKMSSLKTGLVRLAGRILACFIDITERKHAEEALRKASERGAFRVELSGALRPLANASEIKTAAARWLEQRLRASRVTYAEVTPEGDVIVKRGHTDGVPDSQPRRQELAPAPGESESSLGPPRLRSNLAPRPRWYGRCHGPLRAHGAVPLQRMERGQRGPGALRRTARS